MAENIRTYWDRVCVADNCFDVSFLTKLYDTIQSESDGFEGIIENRNPSETEYTAHGGDWFNYKEWFDYILSLNLVPVLPDHDMKWAFRAHTFPVGGRMAEHEDSIYSIAVSIYLSDCEGGELCVSNDDKILIRPQLGRIVVMKCDTPHSVLPVKEGIRKTIQLFIVFTEKE